MEVQQQEVQQQQKQHHRLDVHHAQKMGESWYPCRQTVVFLHSVACRRSAGGLVGWAE